MKKIGIVLISCLLTTQTLASPSCLELKQACNKALKSADELILLQGSEIKLLKTTNEELMSQINTQQEKILDLQYKPWYSSPTTIFLIGIITGGLLHEKTINH